MTVRSGPLLRSIPMRELNPLGVEGDPVYRSHRQLTTTVRARLGEHCAALFARPELDSDSRMIAWHAPMDGHVRSWNELAPDEQARLYGVYTALQDQLSDLSTQLQLSGEESRAQNRLAQVLDEAVNIPDASYLYFVDDQPVVAAWGFAGEAGQVDIRRLELPLAPPEGVKEAAASVASAPVVARTTPWLRWLWLLPLLLLLGLLLGWLLTQCVNDKQAQIAEVPSPVVAPPSSPRPVEPRPVAVPRPADPAAGVMQPVQPGDDGIRIIGHDGGTLIDREPIEGQEQQKLPEQVPPGGSESPGNERLGNESPGNENEPPPDIAEERSAPAPPAAP
ncbi:MAG: hypothetical protein GKR94_21465 [Gammaproteobacteria bacterium]|nr:hypothetical protein [Gammaproteobacteria bacterium]